MGAARKGLEPGTVEAEALLTRVSVAVGLGRWRRALEDGPALLRLAREAARGSGRYQVALGDGLEELVRRGGLATLGRSGVGDVGREDLDVSAGFARAARRLAVGLKGRPLLRAAVLAGEVDVSKAEVLLKTPVSEDAYWTARAKVESVRDLEAHVGLGAREAWQRVRLTLPPGQGEVLEAALELADILEGGGTSRVQQLECLLMEFISSYPATLAVGGPPLAQAWRTAAAAVAPASVERGPEEAARPFDAHAALEALKGLVKQRASVDETLRRACLLVKRTQAYHLVGFHAFDDWCREWLGLSERTVAHFIQVQRGLEAHPQVAEAVRAKVLTLQKALSVARAATAQEASPEEVAAMVAEAAARPAIDAQRGARAAVERRELQRWNAGHFSMVLPTSVAELFQDALTAGQAAFPGATPGEVLLRVARHFLQVHGSTVKQLARHPSLAAGPLLGFCAVPGCSRLAEHEHHLWWTSRGGPDAAWNLVPLCAMHHHRCVHEGTVWVFGRSPDELTWFVGAREVARARRLGYRHGRAPWEQPGWTPDPLPRAEEAWAA